MTAISERHEIRVQGRNETIVFIADSDDGRLIIRQEPQGKKTKDVCWITLSDPDELRAFFKGLRRILASLGHSVDSSDAAKAFAPWTKEEEQEIRKRHESGEGIQSIARARKRSPGAVELRLRRMGVLPLNE